MVIEELLEDPELAKLEKCDELAPLYHVEGIGLHICIQRLPSQFYLAFARLICGEERVGCGEKEEPKDNTNEQ